MSIKPEVGKFYKTANGAKVEILAAAPDRSAYFGWLCSYCAPPNNKYPMIWLPAGNDMYGKGGDFNLIAEWREPVKHKVELWVNYFGLGYPKFYFTRKEADQDYDVINRVDYLSKRIACLHFVREFVEGEGL